MVAFVAFGGGVLHEPVSNPQKRNDEEVDFPDDPSLNRGIVLLCFCTDDIGGDIVLRFRHIGEGTVVVICF